MTTKVPAMSSDLISPGDAFLVSSDLNLRSDPSESFPAGAWIEEICPVIVVSNVKRNAGSDCFVVSTNGVGWIWAAYCHQRVCL